MRAVPEEFSIFLEDTHASNVPLSLLKHIFFKTSVVQGTLDILLLKYISDGNLCDFLVWILTYGYPVGLLSGEEVV